jgi:futalosine hydrolase
MQVLLVAATPFEIAPTIAWLEQGFEQPRSGVFTKGPLEVQLCVTGIGILATSWQLARLFAHQKPDFAINAGVGGAIDLKMQLGDVVFVDTERLADLGVEDADGQFLDLFDLGLSGADDPPFVAGQLLNPTSDMVNYLPKAKGVTVNKVHGSVGSIAALRKKYPDAQVESMEGAAFFYACLNAGVAFAEIRAISNYVAPRNRDAWDLPGAISALNQVLEQMLDEFGQLS